MEPKPYQISVPDSAIDLLKAKLAVSTFPDELHGTGFNYGARLQDVKRLAEYWREEFDWKKQEADLNKLPNYTTEVSVDGYGPLDIHFVYQPSSVVNAIPLLFVHGWPGSFIEVAKLLPLLKGQDGGPAFHVVAPSLPNFGFSQGVKAKSFALAQYAETCHKLMLSLGYNQYVTQGGDWGMFITRAMGYLYPNHVLASHINMVRASAPQARKNPLLALQHAITPYSEKDKRGLERQKWFLNEGSGYRTLQGTKPQTLGYSLADSPVGLLAWIYEKLHDWTDDYPWTNDEILTWISIYWFSRAGPAASVRIYYEVAHTPGPTSRDGVAEWIPRVKLGMAYFPKELGVVPKTWGRTLGPVAYESDADRGGHFAAWENPEHLAKDLAAMFGKTGPCAGIVKGRSGYDKPASKL